MLESNSKAVKKPRLIENRKRCGASSARTAAMMLASGLLLRDFFAQSGSYTQQVKNIVPICVFQDFQTDQLGQKTR